MEEIKCNELPQETTLTNTLKLIGNSDNKIKQIGVDLLKDYVTNTLQGQIDVIQDYIGNLNDLSTAQKDSLVNAVKEVDDKIDVLSTDIANTQTNVAKLNSALDSRVATLNTRFECGSVVIAGKSGEWAFVTVNYTYPHKVTPMAVASHGSTNVAPCTCTIRNKTTAGFEIGVYNTTVQTTFNWIAVEPA